MLRSDCENLMNTDLFGRVAQLVQSTWFTPKGSGVRIPSRPLIKRLPYLEAFFYAMSFVFLYLILRVISSVGSEHYLDRVGVTGSNPVSLTIAVQIC